MPKSCLAIGFVLLGVNVAVIFTYPQHLILAQEKGGDNKPQLFHLQKSEHRVIVLPQKNQEAEKLLDTMSNEGWQVVGLASEVSASGSTKGSADITTQVKIILKRPKP